MDLLIFANILATLIAIPGSYGGKHSCSPKWYQGDNLVCVCNATYCDKMHTFTERSLPKHVFLHFESSKLGYRMRRTVGALSRKTFQHVVDNLTAHLRVDHKLKYQEILGFGGTLTDDTTINVAALNPYVQKTLVRSLFSQEGLGYTMIRVPMGSTEYSQRNYTYDDNYPDPKMTFFRLPQEDTCYKIPFIKMVLSLVGTQNMQLIGCPWRAPKWMYTEGRIHPCFYQSWANYFVSFLDSYYKTGLKFWGVSTQNEISKSNWKSTDHSQWVQKYLEPSLKKAGYGDVKTLFLEDNRKELSKWMKKIGEDIDVIAVHWNNDTATTAGLLDDTHILFPGKPILYTQASFSQYHAALRRFNKCEVDDDSSTTSTIVFSQESLASPSTSVYLQSKPQYFQPPASGECGKRRNVPLGDWEYAETYISAIIEALNHWATGWMEMSMIMNLYGRPRWGTKSSGASIVVNISANEFYKQPTYYITAHFTKFLSRGTHRIGLLTHDDKGIQSVAFRTPGKSVIIVMFNKKEVEIHTVIDDAQNGRLDIFLPARSVHTIIYSGEMLKYLYNIVDKGSLDVLAATLVYEFIYNSMHD